LPGGVRAVSLGSFSPKTVVPAKVPIIKAEPAPVGRRLLPMVFHPPPGAYRTHENAPSDR
jgi:hypothetical protein